MEDPAYPAMIARVTEGMTALISYSLIFVLPFPAYR
jgi:hypothetical protein